MKAVLKGEQSVVLWAESKRSEGVMDGETENVMMWNAQDKRMTTNDD